MSIDPTLQALFLVAAGALLAYFFSKREKKDESLQSLLVLVGQYGERLKHIEDDRDAHKAQSADLQEMRLAVVRMEEHIGALERTLREQPRVIALCVGEAIKAALSMKYKAAA